MKLLEPARLFAGLLEIEKSGAEHGGQRTAGIVRFNEPGAGVERLDDATRGFDALGPSIGNLVQHDHIGKFDLVDKKLDQGARVIPVTRLTTITQSFAAIVVARQCHSVHYGNHSIEAGDVAKGRAVFRPEIERCSDRKRFRNTRRFDHQLVEPSRFGKPADFAQQILKGDPLINIPKHTANLLVTKEFEIGESGKFTVGAGVNHISKRLGETGTAFYLPSYTLVRALASYEPNESMKFSLDVSNLFDKRYYPASYHRYWVAPGAPRAITGRVAFFF